MISDEQKDELLQQYYDRGVLKKEIRSYEISLWTLLDEFITVLKWSDIELLGRVENPKLTLNIDGTEKLTFSIPMYYQVNGKLVENPNWYIVKDREILLLGLRKLKVIFNKYKDYKAVFEFIIINVTDKHEGDVLTCEIEAEGLAFLELGKIGYKLNLSLENFDLNYKEWLEKGYWFDRNNTRYINANLYVVTQLSEVENIQTDAIYILSNEQSIWDIYQILDNEWVKLGTVNAYEPIASLNYWCEEGAHLIPKPENTELMNSRTWYYDVRMNYLSFEKSSERLITKLYEESLIIDWDDDLRPTTFSPYHEKARIVTAENSNLYNITLTIAELFGVFCKYEYLHNDNNLIIGRVVVFYNNFTAEELTPLSFSYPYSAASTERVTNSQDITTKLYVLGVDNTSILAGTSTIMNSPANKTLEDYILNFDYLKKIGAINTEQIRAIKTYEKTMRSLNQSLNKAQRQLISYLTQLPELEAKKTFYENAIALDKENITLNLALKNNITASDGTDDGKITLNDSTCDYCVVKDGSKKRKYITLSASNLGIIASTIRVYKTRDTLSKLSDLISRKRYTFKRDDKNYVTDVYFSTLPAGETDPLKDVKTLYVTYSYSPQLYYDKIVKTWAAKESKDTEKLYKILRLLGPKSIDDIDFNMACYPEDSEIQTLAEAYQAGIYYKLNNAEANVKRLMAEKAKAIEDFEHLMGPAIREGYWQPEDYSAYGEKHTYSDTLNTVKISSSTIKQDAGEDAIIAFDIELFEDEDELFYQCGVNDDDIIFYPCINLNKVFNNDIPKDLNEYSVIWRTGNFTGDWTWSQLTDNNDSFSVADVGVMPVGSNAVVKFLAIKNLDDTRNIIPVLMLSGAKNFTGEELYNLLLEGKPNLAKYSTTVNDNGEIEVSLTQRRPIQYSNHQADWLCYRKGGTKAPDGWGTSLVWTDVFQSNSTTVNRLAYPRIKISSLLLKPDDNLFITYGNKLLTKFEDYYVNIRDTKRSNNYYTEYYITLKPESLIKNKYKITKTITVNYVLSNADTSIYIDALKVSKENAFPKVEYHITPLIVNADMIVNLYNRLAEIIMINDTELKFDDVFGYISNIDLDLDAPWQDSIEVKNYTTKFEDLFSTIVASSEALRKSELGLAAISEGSVTMPLSELSTTDTLTSPTATTIILSYIEEQFDTSEAVLKKLERLFTEAGEILGSASGTLGLMATLSLENAKILSGFAEKVSDNLTVHTYIGSDPPKNFNVGDLWLRDCIDKNGEHYLKRMVATSNSANISGDRVYDKDGAGFTATYDGSLASITGAGFSYDADEGTVNIYGEHNIDIASGSSVYIGANDYISLVGNKSVNIGGSKINIISDERTSELATGITMLSLGRNQTNTNMPIVAIWAEIINKRDASITQVADDSEFIDAVNSHLYYEDNNAVFQFKGQNNVFTCKKSDIQTDGAIDYSKVYNILLGGTTIKSSIDLMPTKISMKAAELELKASSTINLLASLNGTETSVISIDSSKGIWIGSSKAIRLFSQSLNTSANIELNTTHLFLGFNSVNDGSAVAMELTDLLMMFAAGNAWDSNGTAQFDNNTRITDSINTSISGVLIRNNYIGLATGNGNNNRSLISMYNGHVNIFGTNEIFIGSLVNNKNKHAGNAIYLNKDRIWIGTISDDGTEINAILIKPAGITLNSGSIAMKANTTLSFKINSDGTDVTAFQLGTDGVSILVAKSISLSSGNNNFLINTSNIRLETQKELTQTTNQGTVKSEDHTRLILNGSVFRILTASKVKDSTENLSYSTIFSINSTDGATLPYGIIAKYWYFSDAKRGFVKKENRNPTIGLTASNGTDGIPFWIHMPPKTEGNSSNETKVAFWYKNGKVYIRDLVICNAIVTNKAAFGEKDSPTSTDPPAPDVPTSLDIYISNNIYSHQHYINGVLVAEAEGHDGATCSKCGQTGCYGWG